MGLQRQKVMRRLLGGGVAAAAILLVALIPRMDAPGSPTQALALTAAAVAGAAATLLVNRRSFRAVARLRRVEQALAESERRFRRMATNLPGVLFQFYARRDGTIWFTYLSEGSQAVLGIHPPSFPWRADALIERVHPDDAASLTAVVTEGVAEMREWTWEGRVCLESGETRWVRVASRPRRDDQGRVTWDGLLMDLTEAMEAVEALHRREEQLAEAQRIAHIGSWEWDLESGAVAVSSEHWNIFGHPPDAFTWSFDHYLAAIHADDRAEVKARLEESIETGEATSLDYRIIRPDGTERFVTSRGKVVVDASGRAERVLGTVQDVTDRRDAAAALERRIRVEQALTRAARVLSASAPGDISTVLELIGRAIDADRAHLFQARTDAGGPLLDCTHEWCGVGITSALHDLQGLARNGIPWWMGQLEEHASVVIDSLADLPPEATSERSLFQQLGIRASVAVPIVDPRQGLIGCLAFDYVRKPRSYSALDLRVLQTTAEMLLAYFSRLKAEEALRESEERFRQMAESMREVFFMISVAENELIYLSPSYETVWGRPRSDHSSFIESVLPEDRAVLLADVARFPSDDEDDDPLRFVEYRILRPDGSIRWIRQRTFQILDEAGRPYRVTGVCSDVTEQKRLEEELRRAHRVEAMGHLAAGIAHEINTPIQYIGDNVRFLDESYADVRVALDALRTLATEAAAGAMAEERLRELLAVVDEAELDFILEEAPLASAQALEGVHRVAEIVRAMKVFSHPGSGEKVPTDINQAILSTTTVARNEWKYVAELLTDFDDSLPMITCLPGELNQAILNLVVNAAHAIGERQQAEGHSEPGTILVSTRAAGEWVEIRVTDTGNGIAPEIWDRVFDPFFTTKEVGRGTGQGLTFVHSIVVDRHSGAISFETEPGVGTTFVVRLPIDGRTDSAEAAAA